MALGDGLTKFLESIPPDAERLPLIVASEDWHQITPALETWATALETTVSLGHTGRVCDLIRVLRVIIEAVYVMGYERGQREARNPLPVFVVAEEQEPAP